MRAPLLPVAGGALADSPLGRLALEIASPSLAAAAAGDPRAARAIARYTSRARFRPTPAGLLAGVGAGRVGTATAIDLGEPRAHLTISWAHLAAAARGLLDDPEARAETSLRVCPSLLRHGDHVMWLSGEGEALEAELDELLARVLAATARRFTRWSAVARAVGQGDDVDDVLLGLVDDGLLVSDLTPPLVGAPPLDFVRARLARMRAPAARALAADLARPMAERARGELHATLLFPRARVTLDAAVVARAAALAPLLVRLAQALAPPVAERDLVSTVAANTAAELFGPGTLDLGVLALGGYGVRADEPAPRVPPPPPPALLTLLVDKIAAAAAVGSDEIVLDPRELDAILPEASTPPTLELFLVPRRGTDGWLLGLHGPAGATWGRFAHAGGKRVTAALEELARAEPEDTLDVSWTPSASLADLCTHPPLRAGTLALVTWPDAPTRTPAELGLEAPAPLALAGGTPSPLWRIRSTLAPEGLFQLLTGWSLQRQHAPWALTWGALAQQAWLPRVVLGGFVIAPQSWRLPSSPPLPVQVGHEDELLLVDAPDELARLAAAPEPPRAYEIWPPPGEAPVDASGRRVEAVLALVAEASRPAHHPRPRVPPPSESPPLPGWRTFKLFGPPDRQDRVLLEAVAPAIEDARAAGDIDGWFFLRYVEHARHHLRVRARGRFAARLSAALVPAIAAGDVVTVEESPYHPEVARYGPRGLEALFEAASDLACALLASGDDPALLAVCALDAHARAARLSLDERHELAAFLRAGHEPFPDGAATAFRAHARRLHELLSAPAPAFTRRRVPRAAMPDLLHLCANRLLGTDPEREGLAIYLWERTLDGLRARR